MSKITPRTAAVLGAGSWGSALAIVLAKGGTKVKLWDRNANHLTQIKESRINARYLPEIPFPETIECFEELESAILDTDFILIAVPSHGFKEVVTNLKPYIKKLQGVIWATKGLDADTGSFLLDVIQKILGQRQYAVLSGPSFAKEVACGMPTAVTIAANDEAFGFYLADKFKTDSFRSYISNDMIGVQLGGVVKNVLAVAAGISDGLGFGGNARAALITRGLAEMMRLGVALNAKPDTLMGLSGCGDVILSCTDNQSRNRRFGIALGSGLTETEALQKVGQVIESVYNVEQLCRLARLHDVELPISEQVFRIMKQNLSPREAVSALFARSLKHE